MIIILKGVDFLMLKIIPMNFLDLFENYQNPSLKDFYVLCRNRKSRWLSRD